jgi:hypothetical protein
MNSLKDIVEKEVAGDNNQGDLWYVPDLHGRKALVRSDQ